jgi:hypothetical protein
MTIVATYADVQDSITRLEQPGDPDQEIATFQANGALGAPRPILTFRVLPDVSEGNVNLKMHLNGDEVVDVTFKTGTNRAWTEVVDTGIIINGDNTLTAQLRGANGTADAPPGSSIEISDVSFMFPVLILP